MSPENVRKFYETIARIISEREGVKVTVRVWKKETDNDKSESEKAG